MKTVIIERGLTSVEFFEKTRPNDIYLYTQALREAGADYIELNYNSLFRLPKPTVSDNYIYRIERRSDFIIANNLPFSYAVVPLRLSYLIQKIEIPVILEVNIGNSEPLPLISIIAENVELTKISLLRLVGDFSQLPDEINEFIDIYHERYAVPIDLCPTNTSLTALSTAISAYASYADSITLSFGNSDNYASFEEFLITMVVMYKVIIKKSFISGICKASILSTLFTVIKTDNLKALIKQYGFSSRIISILDCLPSTMHFKKPPLPDFEKKTVFDKKLSGLNLEKEVNEQIIEILKNCSIDLFSLPDNRDKLLN